MTAIQDYFEQAEFALAAYGNLPVGAIRIADLTNDSVGMSLTQAAAFAEHWAVVDQYAGGEVLQYYDEFGQLQQAWNPNGLSVTLFEEVGTDRQVVAVRGTQDVNDLVTDVVDIGLLGTPRYQMQYRDLATKVQSWLDTDQLQTGFTVAGHSLGGFLATGLAIEYAEQVVGTYLYNAPGLGNVIDSESIAEQVWRALSPTGGYSPSIVATIHNIVAPSDPVSPVGIAVSPRLVIEIESNANPAHNHSIVTITDALAVYALLAKIDSTFTLESMGGILKASSALSGNSLESVVATVGKLFDKNYSPVATTRDDLYTHLKELQTAIQGKSLTIVSLTNMTAGEIKAIAGDPDMIATRYALKELNPFIVLGADYSSFNMNGELNLVDTAGQGDLSINWIEDRAAMLTWIMKLNTEDRVTSLVAPYTDPLQPGVTAAQYFDDRASGQKLYLGADNTGGSNETRRRFVFGTDTGNATTGGADNIVGGALDDNLYGMSGIDVLNGKGGADCLEGGRDFDMLIGGTGNDTLNGGTGRDLYDYRTGDGNDRIVDADGGILVIHDAKFDLYANGFFVKKADADEWTRTIKDTDGVERTVTLTHTGPWRLVLEGGATLDLGESPDLAKFGIVLSAPSEAAPTEPTIVGDPVIHSTTIAPGGVSANWRVIYTYNHKHETNNEGNSILVSYDVDYFLVDANGNPAEPGGPVRDDTLNGLAGADYIQSKGGNDEVYGQGGKDRIEGGAGADRLHGGDGDDVMLGGTGSADILFGDAGKDTLYAGDVVALAQAYVQGETETAVAVRGEFLDGGADNDILVGSAAEDFMEGGAGADVIYGGAGDDYLSGDGSATEVSLQWAATRAADNSVINLSGITIENLPLTHHGDDVLYGGKGDDWLIGLGGNDFLDGGSGKDLLVGWEGSDILVGGANDDILMGDNDTVASNAYTGNDLIVGGTGTDRLAGGQGNDTYRIGLGDGADTIVEDDATVGNIDVAEFLAGISADQIWLRHQGNNLEASIIGTADKLTVQNWYLGEQHHVEQFKTADGRVLLDSQVENLVQVMAAFAPPGAGQTTLPPIYQDSLAPVIAANWQ